MRQNLNTKLMKTMCYTKSENHALAERVLFSETDITQMISTERVYKGTYVLTTILSRNDFITS